MLKTFQGTWASIKFTIGSFASQKKEKGEIDSILIVGEGSGIKGIAEFAKNYLGSEVKLFTCSSLIKGQNISVEKNKSIPSENILSLSTALITPVNDKFNLRQKDFVSENNNLIIRQLITGTAIIVGIFVLFFTSTYQQTNKLKYHLEKSKNDIIAILQNEFKPPKTRKRLSDIVHYAKMEVKKEKDIWFAFSGDTRSSFLKYLKVISETIHRESLGLELSSLSMKNDEIVMEGSVKGFDELAMLEDSLCRPKLFRVVSPPQSPQFTIHLVMAKEEEGI